MTILELWQSKNGGLAAWEPAGAYDWMEVDAMTYESSSDLPFLESKLFFLKKISFVLLQLLNPTEFFADIVIEHEYDFFCSFFSILFCTLYGEVLRLTK